MNNLQVIYSQSSMKLMDKFQIDDSYAADCKHVLNWLERNQMILTFDTLDAYLQELKANSHPATYNKRLSAIKNRLKKMILDKEVKKVMTVNDQDKLIDSLKEIKFEKDTEEPYIDHLTKEEYKQLLAAAPPKVALLIEFLYATSYRVSEALTAEHGRIKRNKGYIWVPVRGKGGKWYTNTITIDLYNRIVAEFGKDKLLFGRLRKTKTGYEYKQWDRLAATKAISRAGIAVFGTVTAEHADGRKYTKPARAIGAHTLRHTRATHLIEEGHSLAAVSKLLNHSSPAITAKYYDQTRIEPEDLHPETA